MRGAELAARRLATHRSYHSLFPGADLGDVHAAIVPQSPGRSLFNAVTYTDAKAVVLLLPHLADLYARAGVRAWTVWVMPGDGALTEQLGAAGHRFDGSPEAMGAALDALELEGPDVAEEPSWDEMVATNAAAYGVPHAELDAMRLLGDGVRRYGAANGAVVLAVHDHDGDAGVTFVAARPEVRGRGLVGALLRQALRDAVARGCTTTTLESTKLGRPVYERIGFRSLGTLQMWERRSAATAS